MGPEEVRQSAMELSRMQSEYNILQIRLDTGPLLAQIERFLRGIGEGYTVDKETGKAVYSEVSTGIPMANDVGIRSILNWLTSTINPSVVQGNFPVDKHGYSQMYENFIFEFQINFCKYLIIECYEFELRDQTIEGIIDFIMNLIKPFMSRCIGNQERKSYAKTMEAKETHMIGSKESKLPTFKD